MGRESPSDGATADRWPWARPTVSVGYSGTPLSKKLGIKEGHQVHLAGAPEGFERALDRLPPSVRIERVGRTVDRAGPGAVRELHADSLPAERFDIVLLFCPREADVDLFADLVPRIRWDGGIWTCWPKRSSPLHVDLTESRVRSTGLATGLVDNKICAVTADWSALRFVVRKQDRPGRASSSGPESPPLS